MHLPALLLILIFGTPWPLSAQRLSGEGTCSNPEVRQEIPIGDHPNHSYAISKTRCSWTKPFEIAGERAEGGTGVQVDERSGSTLRYRGHYLDRMSSGDTVYYRYEGTATLKDEVPQSSSWTWRIVNGSGKFQGLTGRGTCKGAWPGGTYRWGCAGSYRMPR